MFLRISENFLFLTFLDFFSLENLQGSQYTYMQGGYLFENDSILLNYYSFVFLFVCFCNWDMENFIVFFRLNYNIPSCVLF